MLLEMFLSPAEELEQSKQFLGMLRPGLPLLFGMVVVNSMMLGAIWLVDLSQKPQHLTTWWKLALLGKSRY